MNSEYSHTRFRSDRPPEGVGGDDAWPERFAVLTAHNPQGRPVARSLNEARDDELALQLEEEKLQFWRVTGGDPASPHTEDGYGVVMPFEAAVELGRALDQEAIFWIEVDDLRLVDCADGSARSIGSWRTRQDAGLERPVLDEPRPLASRRGWMPEAE